MLLNDIEIEALHRKYAPNGIVFGLVYTHCKIVYEIAEWCAGNITDKVDAGVLRNACLLHDIGTYALFDEVGKIVNHDMYPQHAIFGAKILADEGLDEHVWHTVETHLLLGLSRGEIQGEQSTRTWPLPARDYQPNSIEGELLCYADRFHSKTPQFNPYETFLARLQESLPLQAQKFAAAAKRFGIPDLPALAAKYDQPMPNESHPAYKAGHSRPER